MSDRDGMVRGVTYVETYTNNPIVHPTDGDANAFNYSGMQNEDGSPKHPDQIGRAHV